MNADPFGEYERFYSEEMPGMSFDRFIQQMTIIEEAGLFSWFDFDTPITEELFNSLKPVLPDMRENQTFQDDVYPSRLAIHVDYMDKASLIAILKKLYRVKHYRAAIIEVKVGATEVVELVEEFGTVEASGEGIVIDLLRPISIQQMESAEREINKILQRISKNKLTASLSESEDNDTDEGVQTMVMNTHGNQHCNLHKLGDFLREINKILPIDEYTLGLMTWIDEPGKEPISKDRKMGLPRIPMPNRETFS